MLFLRIHLFHFSDQHEFGASLQQLSALQSQSPSSQAQPPIPAHYRLMSRCVHPCTCAPTVYYEKRDMPGPCGYDCALTLSLPCTVSRYLSLLSGCTLDSVSPASASTCPRASLGPASSTTAGIRNHVCKGVLAWFFGAFPALGSGQDAGRALCQMFCPVALGSAGG